MRRRLVLGLLAVAVALTAAVCWRLSGDKPMESAPAVTEQLPRADVQARRVEVPSTSSTVTVSAVVARRRLLEPISEPSEPLSPEDQQITDELAAVRDSENIGEMARVVAKAAKSARPDVRRDALDTLRHFGRNGMAEATLFMCDADEDVRNEAFDVWRSALFEFDDDGEKAQHILMMMQVVTDREQLDFMTQQIGELADYPKADTLVKLITGKNTAAREIALREYKDMTGSDFTDVETAQAWLDTQLDQEPESEKESEKEKQEYED